ncbi:hypothetical protein LSAT2_026146, partial [Lamellibrachia satsuma]
GHGGSYPVSTCRILVIRGRIWATDERKFKMSVNETLLRTLRRTPANRLRCYCLIGVLFVITIIYVTSVHPDLHSKWIVATTINHPTKALIALSQLNDWKLVVVGDRKTPSGWAIPGVVFLDVAAQKALGYRTTPLLPYDRYTRKTVGYLFAIEHGARYIYETDDDNILMDGFRCFHIDVSVTRGLMPATDNITFNPYPHFGQASLWPRGYPLELIGREATHNYRFCSHHQASIRQALASGDPDVDAVFRLTRRHENDNGKLMFDATAPPIVIPRGTFVPFNSQDTLFVAEAFWALLLPATLSDRACDIYRSYWAQALLWLVDGHLGFYPPNVMHVRNKHSFLRDLADESEMNLDMGRLVRFLSDWKCDRMSLFDCMKKLAEDMAVNKFLQRLDVDVTYAWVADLKTLGYSPPAIRHSNTCSDALSVKYFPHEQNTSFAHVASMSHVRADISHQHARADLMHRVCSAEVYNTIGTDASPKTQNFLLIVSMHNPTATIPLIDSHYKRCFTHILYCGASTPDRSLLHKWKISHLTMPNAVGAVSCVKAASEMGYSVDGFMHVSDKMLLLSGKNLHINGTSQMLLTENSSNMSKLCKDIAANCLVLTERMINGLSSKLDLLDIGNRTKLQLKECFKRLIPHGASEATFVEDVAFYVPRKHMKLFRTLADLYTGQYSYVSVLLLGCLDTQQLYFTSARQLTADDQVDFIFPFLFGAIDTDEAVKSQYCKALHSC